MALTQEQRREMMHYRLKATCRFASAGIQALVSSDPPSKVHVIEHDART